MGGGNLLSSVFYFSVGKKSADGEPYKEQGKDTWS